MAKNLPYIGMDDGMDIIIEPDDLLTKVIRYGEIHYCVNLLHFTLSLLLGLYFGAIFQIICICAVIFIKDTGTSPMDYSDSESEVSPQLTPKRSHRSRREKKKKR